MGDVGSAIATPFVAVTAVVTGQAGKKVYYNCPDCGQEKWVWASGAAFVGRRCFGCRGKKGPVDLGIVGDAIDVAATPITATAAILTGNANEKIWYTCPKCKKRKYVSAMAPHLAGKVCLKCEPFALRTFKSTVPISGNIASITKIKQDKAEFCGTVIYQQWGQDSNKDYSYRTDVNDIMVSYSTRCCRILHGSVSWAANTVVQTISLGTLDLIDHWWLIITTKKGYEYQLQFRAFGALTSNDNGLIELRKCGSSWYDCNQTGLAEAGQQPDADIFDQNSYSHSYSSPSYTIKDIINWMKSGDFSARWNVVSHNCQDLCRKFHKKF